ncbi:YdcF family protein [Roseibacterium sp. SDUM158017]|uniref:YdcF family protein n=1 Tax=Roseicyclus salinarum TaxID=3036773 RepID=UPI0024154649|nr:YdcF family protein [Roseibacterium sp. SDUM158017]MDG4648781.1 YdcF family protein [Roseibacterium sp. SDUM158017]
MRLLVRIAGAGLLIWAVTLAGVLGVQLLWTADAPPSGRADAIFCLGAGMSAEGPRLPDAASARRARACAGLHAAGAAPVVVFTGYGNARYSAAEAMADVARAAGVPEAAILVEPRARSTIQNAAFGLAALGRGADRVIVVSDPFHLPRAWAIFRLLGVGDVTLRAPPREPEAQAASRGGRAGLGWVFRETLAIWWNVGRLAIYGAAGVAGVDHDTRIEWFD